MPEATSRSVVLEREIPLPPEKIWRALTSPALVERWLMRNDFEPMEGRSFQFRMDPSPYWDGVVDGEVLAVNPPERLAYRWNTSAQGGMPGLRTVVTWSLAPAGGGTHLRLEQAGFNPDDEATFQGAAYGWPQFLNALEKVAAEAG